MSRNWLGKLFNLRLGWLLACIPLRVAYAFALIVGHVVYFFDGFIPKKKFCNTLLKVFNQKDADVSKISRQNIVEFYKNIIEILYVFNLSEKKIQKLLDNKVKFEGQEFLTQALSMGKGLIVLSAHIGSYTLATYAFKKIIGSDKFTKINIFRRDAVELFESKFRNKSQDVEIRVIPVGPFSATEAFLSLNRKEILIIMADFHLGGDSTIGEFLGGLMFMNTGIIDICKLAKVPILPIFAIREKNGTFLIKVEPMIDLNYTEDKARDIQNITFLFNKIIEKYIKEYPEQWYLWELLELCWLGDIRLDKIHQKDYLQKKINYLKNLFEEKDELTAELFDILLCGLKLVNLNNNDLLAQELNDRVNNFLEFD